MSRTLLEPLAEEVVLIGSGIGYELTPRERTVVAMIGQGLSNKSIAKALRISPETVKSHVKHIFSKLSVGSRAEAVCRAGSLRLS